MRVGKEAEFVECPARYAEAAKTEPVAVTREGIPQVYLVSSEEYERYQTMKCSDRVCVRLEDMPAEMVRSILNATADEECRYYDHEED